MFITFFLCFKTRWLLLILCWSPQTLLCHLYNAAKPIQYVLNICFIFLIWKLCLSRAWWCMPNNASKRRRQENHCEFKSFTPSPAWAIQGVKISLNYIARLCHIKPKKVWKINLLFDSLLYRFFFDDIVYISSHFRNVHDCSVKHLCTTCTRSLLDKLNICDNLSVGICSIFSHLSWDFSDF